MRRRSFFAEQSRHFQELSPQVGGNPARNSDTARRPGTGSNFALRSAAAPFRATRVGSRPVRHARGFLRVAPCGAQCGGFLRPGQLRLLSSRHRSGLSGLHVRVRRQCRQMRQKGGALFGIAPSSVHRLRRRHQNLTVCIFTEPQRQSSAMKFSKSATSSENRHNSGAPISAGALGGVSQNSASAPPWLR